MATDTPAAPEDEPTPFFSIDLTTDREAELPRNFGSKLSAGVGQEAVAGEGGFVFAKPLSRAKEGPPYDPEESRDKTREIISLWLIGLLCAIVVLAFVALFAGGVATGFTDGKFFERLSKLLDVLVGPVITLLASAVGFYFGSKQQDKAAQSGSPRGSSGDGRG